MEIASISLGPYDLMALGLVAIFFVMGLIKGFTIQAVRLFTFIAALWLAKRYAGSTTEGGITDGCLAHHLINWFPNQFRRNDEIAVYVAYFLIFLAVLLAGTLIAFLLRALLKRLELRSYDRVLGGMLGIAVGVICVIVIVSVIVSILPDSKVTEKLSQSYTMKISTSVIQKAKPFFPPELLEKIEKAFEDLDLPEDPMPDGKDGK
jgi:uncharacterized membrane protein required for colicin V production